MGILLQSRVWYGMLWYDMACHMEKRVYSMKKSKKCTFCLFLFLGPYKNRALIQLDTSAHFYKWEKPVCTGLVMKRLFVWDEQKRSTVAGSRFVSAASLYDTSTILNEHSWQGQIP